MKFGNIVQDPYYSQIIFRIESVIHQCDAQAKADGIDFKDSDVKSILQKSIGIAKGKRPNIPEKSEKEKRLAMMLSKLLALAEALSTDTEDGSVSKSDWIISLSAVDDSLKTRREMYGHSRGYLDFLKGFLEKGDLI